MATQRRAALGAVLVPTDFSSGARYAAERAVLLPLSAGGKIHLVHVLAREHARVSGIREEAQRLLEKTAALVTRRALTHGAAAPEVVAELLTGEPHVEIIRRARAVDADLVVIGRKGAGARLTKVIGTTAARVVRMGDLPVLVVCRRATAPYRRPLVGMALDESARRVLRLVRAVCAPDVGTVHAVHAYRVPFQGFVPAGTEDSPTGFHRELKAEAAARFEKLIETIAPGDVRLKPLLRQGDPRLVILDEAERLRADLVALGTHGRSGLAHALLGSVAESVIMAARCDVLVARPVRFTFELP